MKILIDLFRMRVNMYKYYLIISKKDYGFLMKWFKDDIKRMNFKKIIFKPVRTIYITDQPK